MDITGVSLPLVGSEKWRVLISKARKIGLTHSQFKQLVAASNKQHNHAFKTGKIKAQNLGGIVYINARGIGAARNFKAAPMANKTSRINAGISFA